MWDDQNFPYLFCSFEMNLGMATALCASVFGFWWRAWSQYPGRGYAAVSWLLLLFLIALFFGTMFSRIQLRL
jgi:membrane-associated phospholipid phosphatase